MPYIRKERREELDSLILALSAAIAPDQGRRAGELNYSMTTLLKRVFGPTPNYHDFNELIGVLESVKLEFYRRAVAPYEDKKIKESGDVF